MTFEEAVYAKNNFNKEIEEGLRIYVVPDAQDDFVLYLSFFTHNDTLPDNAAQMVCSNNEYTIAKIGLINSMLIYEKL